MRRASGKYRKCIRGDAPHAYAHGIVNTFPTFVVVTAGCLLACACAPRPPLSGTLTLSQGAFVCSSYLQLLDLSRTAAASVDVGGNAMIAAAERGECRLLDKGQRISVVGDPRVDAESLVNQPYTRILVEGGDRQELCVHNSALR